MNPLLLTHRAETGKRFAILLLAEHGTIERSVVRRKILIGNCCEELAGKGVRKIGKFIRANDLLLQLEIIEI